MPQQPDRPATTVRRARRLAWRAATVLGPVLVVGVPVGAVAARDAVPTTQELALAASAVAAPTVPVPAAPYVPPPPPVAAPAAPAVPVGVACSAGAGRTTRWARAARPGSAGTSEVALTVRQPAPWAAAMRRSKATDVCLTAPPPPAAKKTWAALPACRRGPATPQACVSGREVVAVAGGWAARVTFRLPPG